MKAAAYAVTGALLLALAGAGLWWWQQANAPRPDEPPPEVMPVTQAPLPSTPAPAASAVLHPIIDAPASASMADLAASSSAPAAVDIESVVTALFSRPALLTMFDLRDFPQRFVATVDNLGRHHSASRMWPVVPARGQFQHQRRSGGTVIAADNSLRYTPHVLLLESVDLKQLAAAYVRLYPQFQRAYEDLGYPRRYFNDRLIEVIDLLLATPQVSYPIPVHMLTINSPVKVQRPWVLYEFDDPALQSLASGQKILLRMGPDHTRRVKERLQVLRQLVASGKPAR